LAISSNWCLRNQTKIRTEATIANLSKPFNIWQVHRPVSAEPLEVRHISLDKCIFLRVRPSLELAFSHHGVCFSRKGFLVNENEGSSATRPRGTTSGIVGCYTFADIGAVSGVEAAVGAAKYVDEEGAIVRHPRHPGKSKNALRQAQGIRLAASMICKPKKNYAR
jgi:hypothetical protein